MILELCIRAVTPELAFEWDLKAILRDIAELVRNSVPLFSFSSTPVGKRIRALKRLCDATVSGYHALKPFDEAIPLVWINLMKFRLNMGPSDPWEAIDVGLTDAFATHDIPFNRCEVDLVVAILSAERWGEVGMKLRVVRSHQLFFNKSHRVFQSLAIAYITKIVPQADVDSLRRLQDALDTEESRQYYTSVIQILETQLQPLPGTKSVGLSNDVLDVNVKPWHSVVQEVVKAIIYPEEVFWMDEDSGIQDARFVSRALQVVERSFEQK